MKILLVVAVLSCFFGACSYLNRKSGLSDDNIIEEHLENILESNLGLNPGSVDFTPENPDGKNL